MRFVTVHGLFFLGIGDDDKDLRGSECRAERVRTVYDCIIYDGG